MYGWLLTKAESANSEHSGPCHSQKIEKRKKDSLLVSFYFLSIVRVNIKGRNKYISLINLIPIELRLKIS